MHIAKNHSSRITSMSLSVEVIKRTGGRLGTQTQVAAFILLINYG